MSSQASTIIRLENVSKSLGPDGTKFFLPSFEVREGERLALVGSSGTGKTTLLHFIAGLSKCQSGVIEVLGERIESWSPAKRDRFRGKNLGVVFQEFNLVPALTVRENILAGLFFSRTKSRDAETRIRDLLSRVGLANRANSRPSQLSVGERQRVAIVRAIAHRPKILLADEPTGSLDPATAQSVLSIMLELASEVDQTLLLVTHDASIANRLDRAYSCEQLVRRPAKEN